MLENDKLPKYFDGGRVIYELENNRLKVKEVPSTPHDVAANALNTAIGLWSTNNGAGPEVCLSTWAVQ